MSQPKCPICNKAHRRFPNNCYTQAKISHAILCGVSIKHSNGCSLPKLIEYINKKAF